MLGDGSLYTSVTENRIEGLSDDVVSSPSVVELIMIWSFSIEVEALNVSGLEISSPVGISLAVGSGCITMFSLKSQLR